MWTKEWPTEPGYYWFYGRLDKGRRYLPETHLVKVRQIANGIAYVAGGQLLYEGEGDGVWQPAILPEPPKDFDASQERART